MLSVAAFTTACGSSLGTAGSAGQTTSPSGTASSSASSTSTPANLPQPGVTGPAPPAPTRPNPWLSYATDVDPGTSIQFVSATTGWRIDGQASAPHLDRQLAAGPLDSDMAWPGSGVSVSSDAGATWKTILTDNEGVWGLDLLSPQSGWVVGVTSLRGTSDGGSTWTTLGEPATGKLVRVDFTSAKDGYGLTTDGTLVSTQDGGASWTHASFAQPATAVCFSTPSDGYLSNRAGDVYATTDGGATWSEQSASGIPPDLTPVWSRLSCTASDAWQSIQLVSTRLHSAPSYVVKHAPVGSASWSVDAANAHGYPDAVAAAPSPVATIGAAAADGKGNALIVGFPAQGLAVQAFRTPVGSGATPAATISSSIPADPSIAHADIDPSQYLHILGVTSAGSNDWLYLSDNAVSSSPASPFTTLVFTSSDGGQSWKLVASSNPQPQPSLDYG